MCVCVCVLIIVKRVSSFTFVCEFYCSKLFIFSIVTKLCVGEGATLFSGLLHFIFYLITLSVKQVWIKYHFLSLCYNSTRV